MNSTSGLQIHSIMYRFHPSVKFPNAYPNRKQIVSQITELWNRYGLESKTSFVTPVKSVHKGQDGLWIINDDPSLGHFDGVMPCVGTCGDLKMPSIDGQNNFKGEIHHSSMLDGKTAGNKKVVIIGGGASAVEGLEFVLHTGARKTSILARSDKWIIPRNVFVDILLSLNIFGEETIFTWIPERLLRRFFYRDLEDLAPPTSKGLFSDTPMVNSDVINLVRQGKAEWLRGDIVRFTENGILFNARSRSTPKGGPGQHVEVPADMVIMATGFHRPSLNFLPDFVFQPPYEPPSWYLQVFPPDEPSICANNCTYVNAIGTVGSWHIGIYTRLLLAFLVDPLARPRPWWAKRWIDMTSWVKDKSPRGAFDFFTYSELVYWLVFVVAINPFRWKWAPFVFFGAGRAVPVKVVKEEDRVRNEAGAVEKKFE